MPSSRRQAREWALQMVFELDQNPGQSPTPEALFDEFWNGPLRLRAEEGEESGPPDAATRAFAERLVRGVMDNREAIDAKISARLRNWSLERLGSVERAVLRLGTYELAFAPPPDAPPAPVAINEAVDLAKFFGTNESGRFVNGVLDALARRERDARARAPRVPETWTPSEAE